MIYAGKIITDEGEEDQNNLLKNIADPDQEQNKVKKRNRYL